MSVQRITSQKKTVRISQTVQYLENFEIKSKLKSRHPLEPQSSALDYGTFNAYKLDDLINMQSDGFNQQHPLRFVFEENNAIHLEEQAVQLLEKYGKNQMMFVGIYGRQKAGKSFLLDRVINLCEFPGTHFTEQKNKQKGLYLWPVPFSKGNTKVFLVDIDGYSDRQDPSYFMLLDFMVLLCSSMLFLAEPEDLNFEELTTIYKHIRKSKDRFKCTSTTQDSFFPDHMCCLFRKPVLLTKSLEGLIKLFHQFSFTVVTDAMDLNYASNHGKDDLLFAEMKKYGNNKKLISESYIKKISILIREIIKKVQIKIYMNLRYTGANLAKLVVNAVQDLNLKSYINVDKVFKKSMKELYIEAYNYHAQLYNESMIQHLSEEEPMEVSFLLKAFRNSSQEVMNSFNNLKVNEELKQQYGKKLEKYIADKEIMVLEINKKKSKNRVKIAVPDLSSKPEIKQITQFVNVAKRVPKNYEQVSAEQLAPRISSGFKYMSKNFKSEEKQSKEQRQRSLQMKRRLQERSRQLELIQRQNVKKNVQASNKVTMRSNLQSREKEMQQTIMAMRSQIQQKSKDKGIPERSYQEPDVKRLVQEEAVLSRQKEKKERLINELRSQPPTRNKELISRLQSQISEKIGQQRQLQSVLAGQNKGAGSPGVTSIQIVKSMTSVTSPRKVQSRTFRNPHQNIRVISSSKV